MHDRIIKEDSEHYSVYRLLDENNNILYIGKSKQMKQRVANHLRGRSNIPQECIEKIKRVEFLEFESETDMNLFEIYAISYFQPPYNKECVSKVNIIRIEMPKLWNELLLDSFYKIIKTDMIKEQKDIINNIETEVDMGDFQFNKNIFSNENLTAFLDQHCGLELTETNIKELLLLCNMNSFDIDEINNYICYNNSKANLSLINNKIILNKSYQGRKNFGNLTEKNIKGIKYLCFRIRVDDEYKYFYGKTRREIADKIIRFFVEKQITMQLSPHKEKSDFEDLSDIPMPTKDFNGGINKLLQEENEGNELRELMTKEEVMENLHIKDNRSFTKLIKTYNLPHIAIGNKYLIPVKEYNKWIKKMII